MNEGLNSKNNYGIILFLHNVLNKTTPTIENILKLFEYKDIKKLSSDMITFKPINLQTVKAVNIIYQASNEKMVSSVIVKLLDQSLDFQKISKTFGNYTIYENGRDVSYELVFNHLESKILSAVRLYTLPLKYADNLETLILNSPSWIDSVEFAFIT